MLVSQLGGQRSFWSIKYSSFTPIPYKHSVSPKSNFTPFSIYFSFIVIKQQSLLQQEKKVQNCYQPGSWSGTTVHDTFRAGDDFVIVSSLKSQCTTLLVSIFVTIKLSYIQKLLYLDQHRLCTQGTNFKIGHCFMISCMPNVLPR